MTQPANDLLVHQATATADELADAVLVQDPDHVHRILTPLTRQELYALAVVLADRVPNPATDADQIRTATELAARRYGTSRAAVLSDSRRREDLDARAVVAYVGHRLLLLSASFVGRQIGRDHSTVLHACGRVGETPRLRSTAEQIATQLGWNREDQTA